MSALAGIDPQFAAKTTDSGEPGGSRRARTVMSCHSPILDCRTSRPACVSQFTSTSADKR
jgi:hypothetical protein